MQVIYVGDSKDVLNRIRTNHCNGNVEGSALRRYVAETMGYIIKREKRPGGSIRIRIALPDYNQGEIKVSNYIRNGRWRTILFDDYQMANDFQWYAIEKLRPLLNRKRKNYNQNMLSLYKRLLLQLKDSPLIECSNLHTVKSGPGVYVLYHLSAPHDFS